MPEYENIALTCDKWEEIPRAWSRINKSLPHDVRKRVTDIMINYLVRFGPGGVFERLNNRTIAQIIAEYEPGRITPKISGEVDGIRYAVYEKPTIDAKTSELD